MKFKNRVMGVLVAMLFLAMADGSFSQPSPPPFPPNPLLEYWPFADTTNWLAGYGYPPLGFANVATTPLWSGNALRLDTTNSAPAFLQYNVVENDGHTNLILAGQTLMFWFAPDWASTNLGGTGPGDWASLVDLGHWTADASYGWWSLYTDPAGCNLYLSAQSNYLTTNYLSAPISWDSNTWHWVVLNTTATNSRLWLDGTPAVTNGPGMTLVPGPDVLTNGFFIGSDDTGYFQARGQFWKPQVWSLAMGISDPFISVYYGVVAGKIAAWQGGGGMGPEFSGPTLGPGSPVGGACVTNGQVYITNLIATPVSGQGVTVTFTVMGGTNGPFDAFTTATLAGGGGFGPAWNWLGQVYTCNTYQATNQPTGFSFYMLALPINTAGGIPVGWCLQHGLNAQDSSLATEDPKNDGLNNLQKYLYGADPQASLGFSVWVGTPNGLSGIP